MSKSRISLALLTVALLLPFVGKPLHIDDPLFVWAGQHISRHPVDFYGFSVNWTGTLKPMAEETKNPPLAAYLLAAIGSVLGWGEVPLHLGFLPVAVCAILGTHALAARLSPRPHLAALALLLSPGFFVSATTLMGDTLHLALFVWAIFFFVRGLDRGSGLDLATAGVLSALAALTKYFGASLVLLLFFYGWTRRRRIGAWALSLLIPVAALAGYQWLTLQLYGRSPLSDAIAFATGPGMRGGGVLVRAATGLAFVGACFAPIAFFAHRLWGRRGTLWLAGGSLVGAVSLVFIKHLGETTLRGSNGVRWWLAAQIAFWLVVGVSLAILVVEDWRATRTAESALLGLWLVGTFVFVAFLNWTINARSVLPLVPAAAILLARRLPGEIPGNRSALLHWPLLPAAALALAVAAADLSFALSARRAAETIHARFGGAPGRLFFVGHWGFQYYLEKFGHQAVDWKRTHMDAGDRYVLGGVNTELDPIDADAVTRSERIDFPVFRPVCTMNGEARAGFYSDHWGSLPFVFAQVAPVRYRVFWLKRAFDPP